MKILLYGLNYYPEQVGIGKYSGEMGEWLARQGHEIRVVTAPPYYPAWKVNRQYSSPFYRREVINGVNVWRCPLWVPSYPTGFKRLLHLTSFAITSLPVMLSQIFWRPDIIVNIEPPLFCAPTSLLVSWLSRAHSWLHIQDYEVDAAFQLGILRSSWFRRLVLLAERWLMNRFDRVSTISLRMKIRLDEKGVEKTRQKLVPNWVDTNVIHPVQNQGALRRELSVEGEKIIALYSGNMGEKQGLELIVAAAGLVKTEKDILFLLCGDGPARNRLKALAEGLPNIKWIPFQPEERLNDLLNLADIHLLPQKADAADLVMPSKLTGMMASGRAILATAKEGTEIANVLEGKGIAVPPGDEIEFVKALKRLAGDKTLREKLGRAAREYAVQHLDKEVILKEFEKELRDLVAR